MKIKLSDNRIITCENKPFTCGTFSDIFFSSDHSMVIKLYREPHEIKSLALEALISYRSKVYSKPGLEDIICWPEGVVVSPRLGVIMPAVKEKFRSLDWFIFPKATSTLSISERGNWLDRIIIAIKICEVIEHLHILGMTITDIAPRNFLASLPAHKLVLIDCDGIMAPGINSPQVLGTPQYQAPEVVMGARPTQQSDIHSLAVTIYRLLFMRHPLLGPLVHSFNPDEDETLALGKKALFIEHPFDHSNRPDSLTVKSNDFGEDLYRVITSTFVDGLHAPKKRPDAGQWKKMLTILSKQMRRLPIYFLLDTSAIMEGDPIEAVRQGFKAFLADLRTDPQMLKTAYISIITFGSTAKQVVPLTELLSFSEPILEAGGETALGNALRVLDNAMENEIQKPTPHQNGDWLPIIFLFLSSTPTDDWREIADKFIKKKSGKIICYIAGFHVNANELKRLTNKIMRLDELEPDQLKSFIVFEPQTNSPKILESKSFDIFLCHNSKDKPIVREIAKRLKEHNIHPWMDEWELPPGQPWQKILEDNIKFIKSAAIFFGNDGIGPWQSMEIVSFLDEFVRRGCPVIPVILPHCTEIPPMPLFLKGNTWVDFRKKVPDPLNQLIWGITGRKL